MNGPTKILLDESEMPTQWYNIVADLPEPPPPPLHPGTQQPATAEDFAALYSLRLLLSRRCRPSVISTYPVTYWMFTAYGGPVPFLGRTD